MIRRSDFISSSPGTRRVPPTGVGPPFSGRTSRVRLSRLPIELESQLDLARRARRQNLPEGVRRCVAGRQADRAGVVEAVRLWIGEPLRVIERVDGVGAELDPLRAIERPVFRD